MRRGLPQNNKINQLIAINIPLQEWNNLPQKVRVAALNSREFISDDSCSRRLIITNEEGIENIPQEIRNRCCSLEGAETMIADGQDNPFTKKAPAFRMESGYNAYQYLLEIFCGIESHIPGDDFIASQISGDFRGYVQRNADKTWLHPVMEKLDHDQKRVRSQILPKAIRASRAISARELTNSHAGVEVVVVADAENGELTMQMIHELSKSNSKKVKEILIVENDESRKEILERQVAQWSAQNPSHVMYHVENMGTLLEFMGNVSEIYICPPAGRDISIESTLAELARKKQAAGNPLSVVFLTEPKKSELLPGEIEVEKQLSKNVWEGVKNIILPQQVSQHFAASADRIPQVLQIAKAACRNCRLARQHNLTPRDEEMLLDERHCSEALHEREKGRQAKLGRRRVDDTGSDDSVGGGVWNR